MRGAGFSLVELLVTVAIMGLLASLAVPFGLNWIDSDRQLKTRGLLTEGVGQARALALRNPLGLAAGAAATCLRLGTDNLMEVVQLQAGQTCTGGSVVWSGRVPAGIALQEVGTGLPFRCVAFDGRGTYADPAVAPDCTRRPQLQVVGRDPGEALDVDLL